MNLWSSSFWRRPVERDSAGGATLSDLEAREGFDKVDAFMLGHEPREPEVAQRLELRLLIGRATRCHNFEKKREPIIYSFSGGRDVFTGATNATVVAPKFSDTLTLF